MVVCSNKDLTQAHVTGNPSWSRREGYPRRVIHDAQVANANGPVSARVQCRTDSSARISWASPTRFTWARACVGPRRALGANAGVAIAIRIGRRGLNSFQDLLNHRLQVCNISHLRHLFRMLQYARCSNAHFWCIHNKSTPIGPISNHINIFSYILISQLEYLYSKINIGWREIDGEK